VTSGTLGPSALVLCARLNPILGRAVDPENQLHEAVMSSVMRKRKADVLDASTSSPGRQGEATDKASASGEGNHFERVFALFCNSV
jgi:hypothetical protein